MKTLKSSFLDALKRAVGPENLFCDPFSLSCYSYDSSGITSYPACVVTPVTTEQISGCLKLAYEEGVPVFSRGAGSGRAGASVPQNGIALALTCMNRIVSVSTEDLLAEVEPGVVTGEFQKVVEGRGLFYPPDPASLAFCTLGGNVATCAGGPRAVKYGVTRDYVQAMEVVLANGEVMNVGVKTAKGVVGYDLIRLLVGSEGTLAVFSKLFLRLIPKPLQIGTLLAFFSDTMHAMNAIVSIFTSGILPRAAEFLDEVCLRCVSREMPHAAPADAKVMLLLEVDGTPNGVAYELAKVVECCKLSKAIYCKSAENQQDVRRIWAIRRGISPAIRRLDYRSRISEDICVPRHALPDAISRLNLLGEKYGVQILSFGHAGDGNLHVNCLFKEGPESPKIQQVMAEIFRTALDLNGTISGEHGIGLTKKAFVEKELGKEAVSLMKNIKKVFDAKGILNPHKIFED